MRNENMLSNVDIVKKAFATWKSKSNWLLSSGSILLMSMILGVIMAVVLLVVGAIFGVSLFTSLKQGLLSPEFFVIFAVILVAIILLIIIPIEIFFTVGIYRSFVNMQRTGKFNLNDLFSGLRGFGRATVFILIKVGIAIIAMSPMSIMIIQFIIGISGVDNVAPSLQGISPLSGIIFNPYIFVVAIVFMIAYTFIEIMLSQSMFLIVDDEQQLSGLQAISKSIELMKGYKLKYFLLTLSVNICIIGVFAVPFMLIMVSQLSGSLLGIGVGYVLQLLINIVSIVVNSFYVTILAKFYMNLVYGKKPEDKVEGSFQEVPQIEVKEK